jgi:hypothetical protein
MRKPNIGRPRTANNAFSLSRKLPKLNLPASSATRAAKPKAPQVGHAATTTSNKTK